MFGGEFVLALQVLLLHLSGCRFCLSPLPSVEIRL